MAETRENAPPAILLMGPTASGKTGLAVHLARHLPVEIISVDSALVYRGMDIGTAKPDPHTLRRAPHRLIDFLDPAESYSASQFRQDALREMHGVRAAGRVPLLVGGTMLYFRALERGLADMPPADAALRAGLDREAAERGWPALHAELAQVDPATADRLAPNDRQRIQRALEVYRLTGRPLSDWHADQPAPRAGFAFIRLAVAPGDRAALHRRIAERLDAMFAAGFVDEVRKLHRRGDLTSAHPAVRAVGYRQIWAYLEGEFSLDEARRRALAASRQLAKRQLTWLRRWPGLRWFDSLDSGLSARVEEHLRAELSKFPAGG